MNGINLQLFGAESLINGTTGYANGTNTPDPFDDANTLTPTMKTYYDTELLENARSNLVFAQFGKKQGLPANRGRTVEWRKWNTLPNASQLTEGVVPTGQKMGMTTLTASLAQYGLYVAITDLLDLHAIDNVLLGATEELGASSGETMDLLIRDVLQGANVRYMCDKIVNGEAVKVNTYGDMDATCKLTPDMVSKAATWLKKNKAPKIDGKYVAIIHPSVTYDLRASAEWIDVHKYAAAGEIFTGEIGELHGVRFVESTNAKISAQAISTGNTKVYTTYFLGKDAFGVIDPEGGGLEMIVKDRKAVGGPLEQYSTAGYKFEAATKILYPERLLLVESVGAFSGVDAAN